MTLVKTFIAAGLILLAAGCERTAPTPKTTALDIAVREAGEGVWRISYRLSASADALVFKRPVGDFRKRDWTIETPGARLVTEGGSEKIVADKGSIKSLVVTVREHTIEVEKDYQPFYAFSDGGVLLYTGHFDPDVTRNGKLAPVVKHFEFIARPGESAFVFDQRGARIAYDASDNPHPVFVYFGSRPAIETSDVMAIIDPEIPDWIDDALQSFIPRLFAYYRKAFGTDLARKPDFFLASALDKPKNGFSFDGDTLPGQFQVTLSGDAWRTPSDTGRDILLRQTAHEVAHLWQNLAQPVDGNQPEWIHEGGADAIAAEAMVALGLWTPEYAAQNFAEAKEECASHLRGVALDGASGRGDYKALYACGRVIAVAVARAEGEGASVAGFWGEFIARARAEGGYSEALYFALAEDRTGRPDFARTLARFAQTPFIEPEMEIADFLALADGGPAEKPFPLEPDAAR